jgi:hypothetical protein
MAECMATHRLRTHFGIFWENVYEVEMLATVMLGRSRRSRTALCCITMSTYRTNYAESRDGSGMYGGGVRVIRGDPVAN